MGESVGSDKKIVGNLRNFGRDKELWDKNRESWEMEKCGKEEFVGENGALKEEKRKVWEKDELFNTWSRLNWLVHLEENKIGPYILYK